MVDPDYRGQVMYVSYEALLLRKLLDEFDLVFTTTGKGTPGAIRKRLGYRSIGHWCSFVIHEPPAYVASRFAGRLAGNIVSALTPTWRNRRGGLTFEPTLDTNRVAALWSESRDAYKFAPQRDAAFLRWRLLENPFNPAQLGIVTKQGQDFGVVAWSERKSEHKGREIYIEDIFCRLNDVSSYYELLTFLQSALNYPNARLVVRTVRSNNPLCVAAKAKVPRRFKRQALGDGAELLVRTRDEVEFPESSLTMLITEGVD